MCSVKQKILNAFPNIYSKQKNKSKNIQHLHFNKTNVISYLLG